MITIFGFKNTKISEYEIIKMLLMSKSGNYNPHCSKKIEKWAKMGKNRAVKKCNYQIMR